MYFGGRANLQHAKRVVVVQVKYSMAAEHKPFRAADARKPEDLAQDRAAELECSHARPGLVLGLHARLQELVNVARGDAVEGNVSAVLDEQVPGVDERAEVALAARGRLVVAVDLRDAAQ